MNFLHLQKPLYLNANLVYSEMVKAHYSKKSHKPSMLQRLYDKGYTFIVSSLTRMEVLKKFVKEKSISLTKVRQLFQQVIRNYAISFCSSVGTYITLSDDLLEMVTKTPIDFADALHILLAKKLRIPLATHDKKMLNSYSTHEGKQKLYDFVYKPQDLL